MDQPSLHPDHRPAPSRSFVEGLKAIPKEADWKARLRTIPAEHYLDPEGRPSASEEFKSKLKRIPATPRAIPQGWRVAAAVAGLGLVSSLWWSRDPVSELQPRLHVERLEIKSPNALPVVAPSIPLQHQSALLRASAPDDQIAPPLAQAPVAASDGEERKIKPLMALRPQSLATNAQEAQPLMLAANNVDDERAVDIAEHPTLRARFGKTGEQLLARSGGKWGWSVGPADGPVRFRVYANKNQWIALRNKDSK